MMRRRQRSPSLVKGPQGSSFEHVYISLRMALCRLLNCYLDLLAHHFKNSASCSILQTICLELQGHLISILLVCNDTQDLKAFCAAFAISVIASYMMLCHSSLHELPGSMLAATRKLCPGLAASYAIPHLNSVPCSTCGSSSPVASSSNAAFSCLPAGTDKLVKL